MTEPDLIDRIQKHLGTGPYAKPAHRGVVASPMLAGDPDHPYLAAALAAEVEKVAAAVEGTRNATLNEAAFSLGTLVAAGLDESTIRAELTEAATAAGLDSREIDRTIGSGIGAGMAEPRAIPDNGPRAGLRVIRTRNGDGPSKPASRLAEAASTVTLATVQPERVSWLWPGRLPAGKLVILDGDPAVGKSTLAVDVSAHVSTGSRWPDGTPCPAGDVLILSAEDGLADTIRPRLDAAAGDPARVHALTGVTYDDGGITRERPISLADDALIAAAITRHQATLVVVDVLMAYLPTKVDSHRDQDVRGVLARIGALAESTGATVLLLRHLNKAGGGSPLYRGGGSIGIVGAARAGFLAAGDPDDDTGVRRVLASIKQNLAPEPPALAYRLTADPILGVARVEWLGESGATAATLLARQDNDEERSERDEAAEWLIAYLDHHGGEAPAAEVKKAARGVDLAERTLHRARQRAGVTVDRSGFPAKSVWRLDTVAPPVAPDMPAPESGHNRHNRGTTAAPTDDQADTEGAGRERHPELRPGQQLRP